MENHTFFDRGSENMLALIVTLLGPRRGRPDKLLDSYEAERIGLARRLVAPPIACSASSPLKEPSPISFASAWRPF
jgi:hypothetical protein